MGIRGADWYIGSLARLWVGGWKTTRTGCFYHRVHRTQELCMEDRLNRHLQHLLGTMNSEVEAVPGKRHLPDPALAITEMGEVFSVLRRIL